MSCCGEDEQVALAFARDLQQVAAAHSDTLSGSDSWAEASSVDAVTGADAALVLTKWQQYRDLNWIALAGRMRKPVWGVHEHAVADPEQVRAAGFLWRLGDGDVECRGRF